MVQVAFNRPEEMQVRWDVGGVARFDSQPLIVPGRKSFPTCGKYHLKITGIVGREGLELYPTLEIAPTLPRTAAYLDHTAIPIQFTEEDFDQVQTGNFVTKVIYLPDPEFQELAIAGGDTVSDDDLGWAESILSAVGTVDRLPEPLLDAFTGVAGSGPAYIFLVAEALTDAFVAEGVEPELAGRVVTQLLVGSAALLEQEGDPATLRRNVTSPGGTTAAGLAVLDERDLRGAFRAAVTAATERSRELG